jgi:hypothetical protein
VDAQDIDYWHQRADSEFRLAQQAPSLDVARPHYRIAINYLERAEDLKRRHRQAGA